MTFILIQLSAGELPAFSRKRSSHFFHEQLSDAYNDDRCVYFKLQGGNQYTNMVGMSDVAEDGSGSIRQAICLVSELILVHRVQTAAVLLLHQNYYYYYVPFILSTE